MVRLMRIAVLFGGTSEERDVSIASAAQIIPALRLLGHHVLTFDSSRGRLSAQEEQQLLGTGVGTLPPSESTMATLRTQAVAISPGTFDVREIDVVFIALHGGAGEDGRFQAMLDLAGVAYTGSNHIASAIAMDKDLTKRVLRSAGLPTPNWVMAPTTPEIVADVVGWPAVVKPNKQGSTVGLSVALDGDALSRSIATALKYDDEVMIEKFVRGREFTVGVLDGEALPVGEIIVPGEIFDYEAKYQVGGAREVFPASLASSTAAAMQQCALEAHRLLKLGSYSRIDFRLDEFGAFWCLEANSLPGLTATSLLPQAANAAGVQFAELLERICKGAINSPRRTGTNPKLA